MDLPDPALWLAFRDGQRFHDRCGNPVEMHTIDGGTLVLPSGRIVASDPLLNPWCEPFSTRVRPGRYPVFCALARRDVAVVMVLFRDGPPVRWRRARPESFGVDSATGCLMDYRVARFLRRQATAGRYQPFWDRFRDTLGDGLCTDDVCLGRSSGANVLLFHTWGGDCHPASFFGSDARGKVVCLVTDTFLRFHVEETVPDP
jgi:Protein of unknown function (DUF4241)